MSDFSPRQSSLPEPPPWFEQEALPRRLLGRLLTKLEKGQRRLTLRINPKTAPELYDFQYQDVQFLWALLNSLDKDYHILSIKPVRTGPGEEPYENARVDFLPEREALVRHWLNRPALDPYALVWEDTLAKLAPRFEDGGRALQERMLRVPQRGAEQTLRAFAELGDQLQQPRTLRALSARCFWGDSKFLDRHEDLVRALFPELSRNLLARPILMNVLLPEQLKQVLFIENQDNFLALAESPPPDCALVYSAGFRGSAQRIREPGNARFSYLNTGDLSACESVHAQFDGWWFNVAERGSDSEVATYFWGDLDFAGMAILKNLRGTFTDTTAWQPGYAPMLARLHAGQCHGHDTSGKNLQLDPGSTGCAYADRVLLPAMRSAGGFVDQEAVNMRGLAP